MENEAYLNELMSIYLSELVSMCLSDFLTLYNKDSYISKMEFDSFLDQYSEVFQENLEEYGIEEEKVQKIKLIANHFEDIITSHNALFLQLKMTQYKDYFDHMFDSVDTSILLDEEQRRAILTDEDYALITAGSGSGKTTTMAAKAKYLIDKCGVDHSSIIMLALTEKQKEELNQIVNKDFSLGVEISTFHELGKKLLFLSSTNPPRTILEEGQYKIIIDYIKQVIFPDKEKLKRLNESFQKELHFDDICYEYSTYQEYYDAYKEKRYDRIKDDLKSFIQTVKTTRFENKRTLNGEQLNAKPEVLIANFLYENGIDYECEKVNPNKKDDTPSGQPDFKITVNGKRLYIEYFGLVIKEDGLLQEEDFKEYNRYIKKKEKLEKKYGRSLISLYAYQQTGFLPITILEQELKKRNVLLTPRSEKEIYNRIMDTREDFQFLNFAKLLCTYIAKVKEEKKLGGFERFIENAKTEEEKSQLILAIDIYTYYEETLKRTNSVDLADTMNEATLNLETLKEKGIEGYQYIIVDEYQDLSISGYQLMKRLSDIFQSKIVAVGDSWQMLYENTQTKADLFTQFKSNMGYGEVVSMNHTYRNSQELIDSVKEFIEQDRMWVSNSLKSEKHIEKPIEIVYYYEEFFSHKIQVLEYLLQKLNQIEENQKVLLLGRYQHDIEDFLGDNLYKGTNDKIIFAKDKGMDITYLTVSKSKGLGFDQVILLNVLDDTYGFPSKKREKPLLALLKEQENEPVEYKEERKLFYIALTRTKNKVYLLAPYNEDHVSEFVKEIKTDGNVYENKEYIEEEII